MAKKVKKISAGLTVFLSILFCLIGVLIGFGAKAYTDLSSFVVEEEQIEVDSNTKSDISTGEAGEIIIEGDLQIHFLELGNVNTGDCTYIKAGDNDILIDAGSKTTSIPTISTYLNKYVTDNTLEYVIVTHAHEDHYAGFSLRNGSIFDLYDCKNIITFSQTNQSETNAKGNLTMYGNFMSELNDEIANGATWITAKECIEESKTTYDLGSSITMKILDSKFYYEKSSTENNHSVCTLFTYNDGSHEHNYIFTGDLEADGEKELIKRNTLPKCDLYKAGHHGSKTSSTKEFLAVIQPQVVCVCCCAGSSEYTSTNANQFPTQTFVDNVAPYTDKVYVTTLCKDYKNKIFESMNGNIVISITNELIVSCSNSTLVLKEWPWFKENRTCPEAWSDN